MVGIVSYGAYIPRMRLNRMAVAKSMGWFAPALYATSKGERAMANWDEDCLTMAVAASRDALVGMEKSDLDGIYLASTTLPFTDRDNAGIVKSALNLRDDIMSADFSSSLKAGPTALMAALEAAKGGDRRRILVAASDKRRSKAASNQEMLFGDGAGAMVVGNENVVAEYLGGYATSVDFVDHYRGEDVRFDYNWEDRWVRDEGFSKIYPAVFNGVMEKTGVAVGDITKIIYPCIYGRVHAKLAMSVGATAEQLSDLLHVEVGECGAAHPFVMLAKELETAKPGDVLLVAGIGQGATALMFRVTENIKNLPARTGVSGCLSNRKEVTTYTKWLQYNDLIETDLGGRGDQDLRTGLSALYRNRKFIQGFVGGKCKESHTPQIPSARVCVKPDCGAVDSQEEYAFADKEAKILTFTADSLAATLDPPAIYGMVQFDEGGRLMIEFTDCSLDEVEVGVPMKMTFRKKYHDPKRGFTGYFWKAIPVHTTEQ
ncbi:MAG: OB-fold domain-containing protein [Deltaproteobacteria bacterium]|nr:OB-fold domain-containing protein [Deltaproteobacteria bacterium]